MRRKIFVENKKQLKKLMAGYPENGHEPDQYGFTGEVEGIGLDNAGGDMRLVVHKEDSNGESFDLVIPVSTLLAWAIYPNRNREG